MRRSPSPCLRSSRIRRSVPGHGARNAAKGNHPSLHTPISPDACHRPDACPRCASHPHHPVHPMPSTHAALLHDRLADRLDRARPRAITSNRPPSAHAPGPRHWFARAAQGSSAETRRMPNHLQGYLRAANRLNEKPLTRSISEHPRPERAGPRRRTDSPVAVPKKRWVFAQTAGKWAGVLEHTTYPAGSRVIHRPSSGS